MDIKVLLDALNIGSELVTAPSVLEVIVSLLFAGGLASVMFMTYKQMHRELSYDSSFNVMLVMISIITTILILLIRSSVTMSLGMLGSLGLVRFRTNVKDNRDIGFVFWSMAIGLSAAAHAYFLGILVSLLLAGILVLSNNQAVSAQRMLLVVRGTQIDPENLESDMRAYTSLFNLRAQNLLEDSFEIVYEIKTDDIQQMRLSQIIKAYPGVDTVNILAPSAQMDF